MDLRKPHPSGGSPPSSTSRCHQRPGRVQLDGSGLKIAVIDAAPPDLSVPELRGAKITSVKPCKDQPSASDVQHSTAVASILASPEYGWAPKAEYTFYTQVMAVLEDRVDRKCFTDHTGSLAWALNDALNKGADLITAQVGEDATVPEAHALTRAALKGVPVVVSAGNEGRRARLLFADLNTTIGVGAVDDKDQYADFSNWGPGLTIMAPGTGITARVGEANGKLDKIDRTFQGTSFSAPMVAGALALAMQAYPQANGDQITRSMIGTATRPSSEYQTRYGWGILNATKLATTDPSPQSSEPPLLDKNPDQYPDPEQYNDYRDGLIDPMELIHDNEYVYRGTDELACEDAPHCELGTSPRLNPSSPTPNSPTPTPAPATGPNWALPIGIGALAIIVVAAAITILIIRRRKTHATPPAPPQ